MKQQTLALTGISFLCEDAALDNHVNDNVLSSLQQSLRVRSARAPAARMTRADFMEYVSRHMPEVQAHVEPGDSGHAHLELGAMRLATRDAIARDDFRTVYSHFAVVGAWLSYADDDLFNAMIVSYLESLFMGITAPGYRNARSLLPMNLEEALQKIERHFDLVESRRAAPLPTVHVDLTELSAFPLRERRNTSKGAIGAVALE